MAEEYYIADDDLVVLLKDVLGDKIIDEDIEKILKASEDGEMTEDDFDILVDEILTKSKASTDSQPIISQEIFDEEEFINMSASPDKCPVCGNFLTEENYCPICNLKFSFVSQEDKNP